MAAKSKPRVSRTPATTVHPVVVTRQPIIPCTAPMPGGGTCPETLTYDPAKTNASTVLTAHYNAAHSYLAV